MYSDGGPVLRRDIAARQEISADYVAQLFRQLRLAGLVEGVKGPGGGYRLACDAATISAGDVVRAVEGPIAVTACVRSDGDSSCNRIEGCVVRAIWQEVSQAVENILDGITLQSLRDQARQASQDEE
jgi:Rrf2 family protein